MSWVWAPCWCIYLPSKMAIPRWIRRTLWPSRLSWITRFGAPWRRCQTKLPARSASAPLREKVQRKSTTANSPNCNVHCSIHTARLLTNTVFSRSVYLTILHFQDFFFIDSASLVALEAAAGVGLSYLKLHLSIVNFCCAHLPLSIVDALDTTGRQFLAWAPASVENVFYQLLLKDIVNVNMQLTWNQDPLVLGHGEPLANFLERIANHLEQGCELPFSSRNRLRKLRKLLPFQMQFPKTMMTQNHLWWKNAEEDHAFGDTNLVAFSATCCEWNTFWVIKRPSRMRGTTSSPSPPRRSTSTSS